MLKSTRGSQEEEEGETIEDMFAFLGIAYTKDLFKFSHLNAATGQPLSLAVLCSPHTSLQKFQFSSPERDQNLLLFKWP